jgi:hypothetical protein
MGCGVECVYRYYDAGGREVDDLGLARSKVSFAPHDFRFYIKKERKSWFGFGNEVIVYWEFSHQSQTFGSWMWPEGMPLRFDGVDPYMEAIENANRIGSSWRPGLDR